MNKKEMEDLAEHFFVDYNKEELPEDGDEPWEPQEPKLTPEEEQEIEDGKQGK